MATVLAALLHLQDLERQLAEVKQRLRVRQNAVSSQARRIEEVRGEWESLNQQRLARRKEADTLELELKERQEKVASLRGVLNTAKTNKEYAAILTELNTIKADNAKLEEKVLKVLEEVDDLKARADERQVVVEQEERRLEEIRATSTGEVEKLIGMSEELSAKRAAAARQVPSEELALFERIARKLGGDAMAPVEVHGTKPPHDYVCGGCFMSLNAEHANALRTRDEIRICDSCGRILYLEAKAEAERRV